MWMKRCSASAPSTRAAFSSCCGTVCRPASIMIMANGNSFQTLTTIREGNASSMLSRKLIGRSVKPSCTVIAPITPKSL
jgi:hypothetical protein